MFKVCTFYVQGIQKWKRTNAECRLFVKFPLSCGDVIYLQSHSHTRPLTWFYLSVFCLKTYRPMHSRIPILSSFRLYSIDMFSILLGKNITATQRTKRMENFCPFYFLPSSMYAIKRLQKQAYIAFSICIDEIGETTAE